MIFVMLLILLDLVLGVIIVFQGRSIRWLRSQCKMLDDNVCTLIDVVECELRPLLQGDQVGDLNLMDSVQDRDN